PGVIAVVRNQDARCLGRLEYRGTGRHGDLPSFDGERDALGRGGSAHAKAGTGWMCFFLMSASKSARNLLMPETTGTAHESLNTQIVLPVMLSAMESSVSRSSWLPSPAAMRSTIFVVHAVPSRHCVQIGRASC